LIRITRSGPSRVISSARGFAHSREVTFRKTCAASRDVDKFLTNNIQANNIASSEAASYNPPAPIIRESRSVLQRIAASSSWKSREKSHFVGFRGIETRFRRVGLCKSISFASSRDSQTRSGCFRFPRFKGATADGNVVSFKEPRFRFPKSKRATASYLAFAS